MFKTIKKKTLKMIVNVKEKSLIARENYQHAPVRDILTNQRGGILDIVLDVAIGVVLAALFLVALKNIFNVNILPSVTDKITGLFS